MTNIQKPVLLASALMAAFITAYLMSSTLHGLVAGGGIDAYVASFIGVSMEGFKYGLSAMTPVLLAQGRRLAAVIAAFIVLVLLGVSTWAGNERFTHSISADTKEGAALNDVRLGQIDSELEALGLELKGLASAPRAIADTTVERQRLSSLEAQAKDLRSRMALTKAAELESTTIAAVVADIARKEAEASNDNRVAAAERAERESEIRAKTALLHSEQVSIASRTSKVESTDIEVSSSVLMAGIIIFEIAAIFVFFVYAELEFVPRYGSATPGPKLEPLLDVQGTHSQVVGIHSQEPSGATEEHAEVVQEENIEPATKALPAGPIAACAPVQDTPAAKPSILVVAPSHPAYRAVHDWVEGLIVGAVISNDQLKSTFKIGGTNATVFCNALGDIGLIAKQGRSWIRV